MKRLTAALARGLVLAGLVWQASASTPGPTSGNPYQGITGKNSFGLRAVAVEEHITPFIPTKLVLQGITVLFGRKEALVRLPDPAEPGRADKERALIMVEGDRWGLVEVVRIDPEAREVEFKDSGNSVKLKLAASVTKAPSASPHPQQVQLTLEEQDIVMRKTEAFRAALVQLTPEEQIIVMEVERERNKKNPDYPPLPPTPLPPASSMPPTIPPTPGK